MSHADDIRTAEDEAVNAWVEGQLAPLRERLVVADASVAALRTTVAARDARIDGLEAERADLLAQIAELEAHECPVIAPVPVPIPSPWRLSEAVDLSSPKGWVSEP